MQADRISGRSARVSGGFSPLRMGQTHSPERRNSLWSPAEA